MARFDWEKARDRDRARVPAQTPPDAGTVKRRAATKAKRGAARQDALAAFVEKHEIGCFKCGASKAEWAKTGISKRGPWAICAGCAMES